MSRIKKGKFEFPGINYYFKQQKIIKFYHNYNIFIKNKLIESEWQ